ncbi:molybdopterin-dependent oxidoreductase alpha subunit [Hamadaea flava]|uniref:FdhF/YdeP family oxidoreductase n=1 Tax=Hamadaea flava TaxID=1742688 RepID=A0ABV8LJL4_9ACTN|nr:FdhF/YdeP family oxidoreductase [Hamadaea flava]MCP2325331.1 molybdopterin-dependent oxidoreductase alpha subunit [Hamadaea flava]
MAKKPPISDPDERHPRVGAPMSAAAGVGGVTHGLTAGLAEMGVRRTALTLLKVNQTDGFDCPGCAWPEPRKRAHAEFCENGAKAVAEEATLRRVTPEFFAEHSIADLAGRTDYWLGQQGRLTTPMVRRPGGTHYEPISWADAFALTASKLRERSPDEALFYTSGRTSNEAAFLYQLFARAYGTNNLPDCSNMCHESSGTALTTTIGIGKGSVTLDDIHAAKLLVIVGQNPGTNHPRMLTALEKAKKSGAKIIAVNPLPEAGLLRFKNPQRVRGLLGSGTPLADRFLQIRLGGDLALFQAIGSLLLKEAAIDQPFVDAYTAGFEAYEQARRHVDWRATEQATGLARAEIEAAARDFAESDATIVCWAMGLTQGRDAVATIREIVNVQLVRGMIGRPGAGLCPVRGHSNVQGDRTMGIWHEPPAWVPALGDALGLAMPAERGFDTVEAIRAMRDGAAKVFFALGGNFAAASPDTAVTEAALASCELTVHVSTKLNRSHTVPGTTSLILPCLGRTERDEQAGGDQFVTVEDSMSCVHSSQGRLEPAGPELRSEVAIICDLAAEVLGDALPWPEWKADYRQIRTLIERHIPGFDDFEARVAEPGGFTLPHPPRDERRFATASGKAQFTVSELTSIDVPEGRLLLQSVRSHDQYNTTIYGLDDRYRGIKQGRRVVFVHPEDLAALGIADASYVDIVSEWPDGERLAPQFRVVAYPTARGCAATYFPEANVLVPLDATAKESNTPTSKQIVVRLQPCEQP